MKGKIFLTMPTVDPQDFYKGTFINIFSSIFFTVKNKIWAKF